MNDKTLPVLNTKPRRPPIAGLAEHEALQRYTADQRALTESVDLDVYRRTQRLDAKSIEWINDKLATAHHNITAEDSNVLIEVGRVAAFTFIELCKSAIDFAVHVSLGATTRVMHTARREQCGMCTFRVTDHLGVERCEAGGGCRCPRVYWWRIAHLGPRLWFRAFGCPIARFGPETHIFDGLAIAAGILVSWLTPI